LPRFLGWWIIEASCEIETRLMELDSQITNDFRNCFGNAVPSIEKYSALRFETEEYFDEMLRTQ
jgi:hypothetical protein